MKLYGWYLWRASVMAQMRADGATYRDIADRFDVAANTVYQIIRAYHARP